MSQFYKGVTAGDLPPSVILMINTDVDGPAVAVDNELDLFGRDTNTNNDNGIQTANDPDGSDIVYVELTNRNTATVTTTDATPTTLLTIPLGAGDGTYLGEGNLVVYNVTSDLSAGYTFVGVARSSAGVSTEIGFELKNIWEEGAMSGCDFSVSTSGNNIVITVTGLAGATLNWSGLNTYRYVG